jgi:hypothetical protein
MTTLKLEIPTPMPGFWQLDRGIDAYVDVAKITTRQ